MAPRNDWQGIHIVWNSYTRTHGWADSAAARIRCGHNSELAVFSIQHFPDRPPPGFVQLAVCRILGAGDGGGVRFIVHAAFRAAIGEARFVRLQLELFGANGTDFDGKWHRSLRPRSALKREPTLKSLRAASWRLRRACAASVRRRRPGGRRVRRASSPPP